jgi:putative nucleotidyltransferase with HDIG domain
MIRELSGHEIDALHYELLVKDIVSAAEKLPPFPDIAWRILSLIKAMAPVKEIEKLIGYDQAMTARVLRVANSAYYGRQFSVRSLKDAILLLGDKRLIQTVMATCATTYYVRGGTRDERDLWEHSVTTALMSEIAARHFKYDAVFSLYTAALLHDIGKTILDFYSKIYLQSSLREIRDESDAVRAERRALGIDHEELGGIIAGKWRFPADITAAIAHHHNPPKAGQYEHITSLVYLVDRLAVSLAKKNENKPGQTIVPESDPVLKKFRITRKMIDDFHKEVEIGMADVVKALGTS